MGEVYCNSSADCLFGDLQKDCYESAAFSSKTHFCDCNNWYGWKGDNCDEISVQVIYFRTQLFILLFATAIFMIVSAYFFNRIYKLPKRASQRNILLYICILIFLACFFLCLNASFQLRAMFDATHFERAAYHSPFGFYAEVVPHPGKFLGYSFQGSAAFFFCGVLLIGETWLECASGAQIVNLSVDVELRRRRLYGLIAFFLLGYAATFFLDSPNTGGYAVSLGSAILVVFLFVGKKSLFAMINMDKLSDLSQTKGFLNLAFRVYAYGLLATIILTMAFTILFITNREKLGYGTFNYIMFTRDIAVFGYYAMISYTFYYIARILATLEKDAPKTAEISAVDTNSANQPVL